MDALVEERIKRSEAETGIKIAKIENKIDRVIDKLDGIGDSLVKLDEDVGKIRDRVDSTLWQTLSIVLAAVVLLIGVWAYQTQVLEMVGTVLGGSGNAVTQGSTAPE